MCGRRSWHLPVEVIAIGLTIVVAHGAFLAAIGVRMAPDSYTYSALADDLVRARCILGHFLSNAPRVGVVPSAAYLGFVTLVAVAKTIAPAHWLLLLVV